MTRTVTISAPDHAALTQMARDSGMTQGQVVSRLIGHDSSGEWFTVTFGGPAISQDMAFLENRLGKDATGVVRYCVSCMAGQLGADFASKR